ncbi:MAG: hypothetical protein P1V35_16930, partial [Planctomycetota bacterium]|nr:hypothetical protein [Planctomycetota bacterium]
GEASPALRRLRTVVLSAAALMLVWLFGGREWMSAGGTVNAADASWPETTTLRGSERSNWLAPLGKVLAREDADRWNGDLTWYPSQDAQSYRVTIHRNDGGAFDRGTPVVEQTVTGPSLRLPSPLPSGHYTVELFATVFGLESPQAVAEFQVVAAPAVLADLQGLKGPARVQYLHRAGWLSDALVEAKQLPQDSERERYIKAMEAR